MMTRIAVRLGIAFLAFVVGTAALEVAARLTFDRHGMHYGLEMWKYARSLKRLSADPAMGHEHVPGSSARLMGVDVQINTIGLRDREFLPEPAPGVHRVLVLGDSMTFGWGVDQDLTYAKVAERTINARRPNGLSEVEVINSGVGNYNTTQQVAYFKQRGLRLRPQQVVLGYYINDAEPTPERQRGILAEHSYLYVLATSTADALMRRMGRRESYIDYYRGLYDEKQEGWRRTAAALEDLARLCAAEGIAIDVLLIPELHYPDGRYPFGGVHRRVAAQLERLGVPAIDLQDDLQVVDPRTLWVSPGDAHPNASAHARIARRLHEVIERRAREWRTPDPAGSHGG